MPHAPSARESRKMYFVMTLRLVKTSLDLDMETKVSRMPNFYVSKWILRLQCGPLLQVEIVNNLPTRQTAKHELFP